MRIKEWGIPTLLEADDPESAAALCRHFGFDFIELNMNLPVYQQWDIPLLQSVADRYQVYFTIHLDERMDLCDFNPRVAAAYLDTLLETIKFARQLHAPILNMHLAEGVYFTLPGKKAYLYEMYKGHFLSRLQEAISRCEEAAEGEVIICVENTGNFGKHLVQEALGLFLQSPLFALTFDIGHSHSAGDADKPFILAHKRQLRHFHIHDAIGGKNHLPLGTGEIDLPWHFTLAAEQGCRAVLEVKTAQALKESVAWLQEQGFWERK